MDSKNWNIRMQILNDRQENDESNSGNHQTLRKPIGSNSKKPRRKLKYRCVQVKELKCINEPAKPPPTPKWKFVIPEYYQVEHNIDVPNVQRIYLTKRPISKHNNSSNRNPDPSQEQIHTISPPSKNVKQKNTEIATTNSTAVKTLSSATQFLKEQKITSVNVLKYKPENRRPYFKGTQGQESASVTVPRSVEEHLVHNYEGRSDFDLNTLGYHWVRRYIDTTDNSVLWQKEDYLQDLQRFREANRTLCLSPRWNRQPPYFGEQTSSLPTTVLRISFPKDLHLFNPRQITQFNADSLALSQNCVDT